MFPDKTDKKQRIHYIKAEHWDPTKFGFDEVAKCTIPHLKLASMEKETLENGVVSILNTANISWYQLYKLKISDVKLCSDLTDKCLPVSWIKFHVVFESKVVDVLYAMFKPFLSEEIKSKIIFHGSDMSTLHKYIDPSILPPELGGTKEIEDKLSWYNQVQLNKDKITNFWSQFGKNHRV